MESMPRCFLFATLFLLLKLYFFNTCVAEPLSTDVSAVDGRLSHDTDCVVLNKDIAAGFEQAIQTGQWACAGAYIRYLQLEAKEDTGSLLIALQSRLDVQRRRIEAELTALHQAISASKPAAPRVTITPAFEWCQSASQIFLNIKFAHKLDAPATLNVETDAVDLLENRVRLVASSKSPMKSFLLEFPLFSTVIPSNSTFSMSSVGRMSITLAKAETPSRWPQLVHKTFNVQKSLGKSVLHFWHDMHQNYASELELLDDPEDDEDDKKAKQKLREKKKRAEEAERLKIEKAAQEKAAAAVAAVANTTANATDASSADGATQPPLETPLVLDPEL